MKLHGWCERCRKVKRVNASGLAVTLQPIIGVCDECTDTASDTPARPRARRPNRPDTPT